MDEAARHGVDWRTIHEWKALGYYAHLTFRYVNSRLVFVSGPDMPRPQVIPHRTTKLDWVGVDWNDPHGTSKRIGCSKATFYYHRRQLKQAA